MQTFAIAIYININNFYIIIIFQQEIAIEKVKILLWLRKK